MSNSEDRKLREAQKKLERFTEKAKGHRIRVKERFLKAGAEAFTDEDLLELLLFFSIPRKDTRGLARTLLQRYQGRLDKVLDAPIEELANIPNLGVNSLLPLKVVHEVAKRYLKARLQEVHYLKSPKEVYEYLLYELKGEKREVFMVLYLASDLKVLSVEKLFLGTINESIVYPREIFGRAYQLGASQLIIAHNHPSGNLTPSEEDKNITRQLILIGKLLQLKIIDHLILGGDNYYSFAETGLMDELEKEVRERLCR
ncbi:MAG: RadC family protein [Caldimicrobium sp.]